MSPRHPTPEERALWREMNRHTRRPDAALEEAEAATETAPATSAPLVSAQPIVPLPTAAKKRSAVSPLVPLATRQAARQFKPHGRIEATLDLHGYTREQAYHAVQHFVADARAAGARHVSIITGKGRKGEGVLRDNVPHWLNEPMLRPHISAMAHAAPEKGGNGVLHVLLKKPL